MRYQRMIDTGLEEGRAGHFLLTPFNHQIHRRGQIHPLLTQGGGPPPLDVIFYLEAAGEAGSPEAVASAW